MTIKKKLIINKDTVKNLILKTEVKTGAPINTRGPYTVGCDTNSGTNSSILNTGC